MFYVYALPCLILYKPLKKMFKTKCDFFHNSRCSLSSNCSPSAPAYDGRPSVFRTILLAILLNSSRCSRHIIAASTLAPDSSLGSANNITKVNCCGCYAVDQPYPQALKQRSIISSLHSARGSIVRRIARTPLDHLPAHAIWICRHDRPQRLHF